MNTYTVGLTPEAGGVRTLTFSADRVEYPANPDRDDAHLKFFVGDEFVGSVSLEYVYMLKKESSASA